MCARASAKGSSRDAGIDAIVAGLTRFALDGVIATNTTLARDAVAGLLTNGYVATAVDGQGVPAAFTRIAAFRAGLSTDDEGCYKRYQ